MPVADDGLDSFFGVGYLVEGGGEFLVDEGSFSLSGVFEDEAGEGDGEVCGDDDSSDSPPGCAAQGADEDGGESGEEAGDGGEGGGVHRVDALPARDGWAASCLNEPCGDGWDGERRHWGAAV